VGRARWPARRIALHLSGLLAGGLAACGGSVGDEPGPGENRPPARVQSAVPRLAPDVTFTSLEGEVIRLAEQRGKVVILDFWATWCGPCRLEIPHFIALQNEYGPRGLRVIGVAVKDREDNVRLFAERSGMNYPTAMGDDAAIAAFGGFTTIPTTFVVAPDGTIAACLTGYQDKQVFAELIEKLVPAARPLS
jgi:thiol-disulfide isomerase/thioredoxin